MLYKAKCNKDEGVFRCKVIGDGEVFGYKKVNDYFVDNSGFGADDEPAFTASKFLEKVRAGFFYGITSQGQFQVYIGEFEKVNRKEAMQKEGITSSKLVKNNTRETIYNDGKRVIRLHLTDILTFTDNKVILNSGGWDTLTTRARFNQFLPDYIRVFRNKGITYIQKDGEDKKEFFDGITVDL